MTTNTPISVRIELGNRSYPILIGAGLLSRPELFANLPAASAALIVSNTVVAPLYASALAQTLATRYAQVHTLMLPDGEVHKNWETLNLVFDALLHHACDRKTVLFALGGGVVGDMTGYAAASYMRGVLFVQVPTSLLAQVDSSVGGKTGINHPAGKNMIGAFYQPQMVVCDLQTLASLPARELSAGLAEIIKYGPIADLDFMAWLERNMVALRQGDVTALAHAVQRSCEIKAWVVAQDERESGLRAILNFGHTFGHAIEAGMGYGQWLHGEAVGCGMLMAAHVSVALGLIDASLYQRLHALVEAAGLPTRAPMLAQQDNAGRYLELMRLDKKAQDGAIQYVLLDRQSGARVQAVEPLLVRQSIDYCCTR